MNTVFNRITEGILNVCAGFFVLLCGVVVVFYWGYGIGLLVNEFIVPTTVPSDVFGIMLVGWSVSAIIVFGGVLCYTVGEEIRRG